ncbi:MAG: GNAT family N-acetyltransferase [Anaerolineaceae bacterium]|nr:GNAT family N-acetyltransferase [Anaerolineaceae bacterium]
MSEQPTNPTVTLRDVIPSDLPTFFIQQQDPQANYMAAFTSRDPSNRTDFDAHWVKIMNDDTIINRTILYNGQVAGNIAKFIMFNQPEIGYWIGKEFWGKGIATRALQQFLKIVTLRPLYAAAAKDNAASLRVLQKCGFVITGYGRAFAEARGEEIDEAYLELKE